jgi:hypothetical protein
MLLRVIEKHEAPPFTQQPQRRFRPDGLASTIALQTLHNS